MRSRPCTRPQFPPDQVRVPSGARKASSDAIRDRRPGSRGAPTGETMPAMPLIVRGGKGRGGGSGADFHQAARGHVAEQLQQVVLGNPVLARRVFEEFRVRAERRAAREGGQATATGEVEASALSSRELEVLDCLVMGRSNKEIGDRPFITEQTVKNHMTSVLRKLNASDRVGAILYAVRQGWMEVAPPVPGQAPASAADAAMDKTQTVA